MLECRNGAKPSPTDVVAVSDAQKLCDVSSIHSREKGRKHVISETLPMPLPLLSLIRTPNVWMEIDDFPESRAILCDEPEQARAATTCEPQTLRELSEFKDSRHDIGIQLFHRLSVASLRPLQPLPVVGAMARGVAFSQGCQLCLLLRVAAWVGQRLSHCVVSWLSVVYVSSRRKTSLPPS